MSYSDDDLHELLLASGERWRSSVPDLDRFSVGALVRRRGRGWSLSFSLAGASSAAAVVATIALLALLVAGPLGSQSASPSTVVWPPVLYLENRGGPAFTVAIDGVDVATVACDGYSTLSPGTDNVPNVPWSLTITRDSDGTTLAGDDVTSLPIWFVQIGDSPLGLLDRPVSGPMGPTCPPAESAPPSNSPSAAGGIDLWTAAPPPVVNGQTVCRLALHGGRLVRHPESGLGVQNAIGRDEPIVWPFGFTARDDGDSAVLIDADGDTVAREGDLVQFGGGLNADGVFAACGGVGVVSGRDDPDAARLAAIEAINLDPTNFGCPYIDEVGVLVIQYVGENRGRSAVESALTPNVAVRWTEVPRSCAYLKQVVGEIADRVKLGEDALTYVFSVSIDSILDQVEVTVGPGGSTSDVSQLLGAEYGDAIRVVFSSNPPIAH